MWRALLCTFVVCGCVVAQVDTTCFPPCRPGYLCHNSQCISKCNPPCPPGTECTDNARCVPYSALTPLVAPVASPPPAPTPETPVVAGEKIGAEESKLAPPKCGKVVVVRPRLVESEIGGKFSEGELVNASNLVAGAIADAYEGSTVIWPGQLELLAKCNAMVIVPVIRNYRKLPGGMELYRGNIDMELMFYGSPHATYASRRTSLSATGDKAEGDSGPFMDAINALCRKIRGAL